MREWGWFVILQKTRPLIGMPNPEEELRVLEEQANAIYGKYDEQLKTKARLLEENEAIKEEKKALMAQLEKNLVEAQDKLAQREAARQDAMQDKKVLEQEVVAIKKDIDDIMVAIQKLEQEKTNRDHTIK